MNKRVNIFFNQYLNNNINAFKKIIKIVMSKYLYWEVSSIFNIPFCILLLYQLGISLSLKIIVHIVINCSIKNNVKRNRPMKDR